MNRLRLDPLTQTSPSHSSFLLFFLFLLPYRFTKKTARGQKLMGQTSSLLSSRPRQRFLGFGRFVAANQPQRERHGGTLAPLPAVSWAKAPRGGSPRPRERRTSQEPGLNPAEQLPVAPASDSSCDVSARFGRKLEDHAARMSSHGPGSWDTFEFFFESFKIKWVFCVECEMQLPHISSQITAANANLI